MCIRSRHGVALMIGGVILLALACRAHADEYDDRVRELIASDGKLCRTARRWPATPTGTLYTADNTRYRVLCFQPEFQFEAQPLRLKIGEPAIGIAGAGGLSPLKFTVDATTLPAGVQVDPQSGIITGTPTDQPGESQIKIAVRTALGEVAGTRAVLLQN